MKLAKYIHDLLLENETVIIPGLGAFISTYKPAEISGNEIKPPSKEISFSQQIRNNDGLLVAAIARKAKISQPNALKRIERARENILYQLDNGENVVVENLGILFYNEKNEIQFTSFQEDNLLLDSFGLEPISMEDLVEKTIATEPAQDLIEVEDTILQESEIDTEAENVVETVSEQKSEKIILPEYKHAPAVEKSKERKKAGWYWYLLILIPVFVAGYFVVNNNSKSNQTEISQEPAAKEDQQEIAIETKVLDDSTPNDSIVETSAIVTRKTESVDKSLTENSKYYLVGGGFKNEENAEKFIVRLKEKGIDGIRLGKRGNLYLIGIEEFDTEQEAYNSLNKHVKKYPEWNIWVFKN
ncbi:MAG TPA: SPOR domain-containing protein [Draconibacterium sp.]|nr:SPOR domain-containing protein [Draconibacterium sp.]